MKYVNLYESYSNSSNQGDFYSKFWIEELSNEFGTTIVDKYKNVKPLYGGGTYSMIGYKSELENDDNYSAIIIEGITFNGSILTPSILLFDKRGYAVVHGTLIIDINQKDIHSENISKVIEATKDFILNAKKS